MYYTVKEAARNLRLSEKTIRNKISQGEIQTVRVTDKSIRIKESALTEYVKSKNKIAGRT